MTRVETTVHHAMGLHARPAAAIVQAARGCAGRVTITREGSDPVDARSLMGILRGGFSNGTALVVAVEDEADSPIAERIATIIGDGA